MPTQDELLALINSLDEEREEAKTDEPKPARDSSAFKELRDHAKRLEREQKKSEEELAELRAFKQRTVMAERTSTLTGAGLTEAQSQAFLKLYDDVTPEAIQTFRAEVLGVQGEEVPPPAATFTPTANPPSEPASKVMTGTEFKAKAKIDPEWARRFAQENENNPGAVDWSK